MSVNLRIGQTWGLVALVSALLFLMALFFSVLAPLLPSLKHDFGLSTFQAGVLVAIYGVGAVAGAIPAALIALRIGVKPTAFAGLAILALASVVFGLASSYGELLAARFMQGVGDYGCGTPALAWMFDTVPVARRGEMLGITLGASAAGAVLGPVFGAIAVSAGRGPSFIAIAIVCMLLILVALPFPPPPRIPGTRLRVRVALGSGKVQAAMWLNSVPGLLAGAILVIAPLELHHLGASAGAIAACYGAAALIGVPLKPFVGRWSDKHGRRRPIRVTLVVVLVLLLTVPWIDGLWLALTLISVMLVAISVLTPPILAMLSDASMAAGASQLLAVMLMNIAGAPGSVIGSLGAGLVTQAAGQSVTYVALAILVVVSFVTVSRSPI
jgi:DHA1 family multidrug resistance protein-like MFS transporter